MQPETAKLLWDMSNAAARIQKFTAGKSFDDYAADDLLRSGVERQYEIIGEAMTRLIKRDRATALRISEYHRISGFRNVLIHGYDTIRDSLTWRTVHEKLPILVDELKRLMAEPVDGFPQA